MFTLQTFRVIKSPESTLLYLAYCPGAVPSFNLCAKIGHIVVAERYFFPELITVHESLGYCLNFYAQLYVLFIVNEVTPI